jgi:hypothetical protein
MFLVHQETGLGVMLGKEMGAGWYKPPSEELMDKFFSEIGLNFHEDLFLFTEDDNSNWIYGEALDNGLRQFINTEEDE